MVIEGAARGRPAELAAHLLRTDHNESVNILDMWGIGAPDLTTALHEMHAIGAGAKSKRTLYHANIDPRETERLTADQKRIAVGRLGRELGLDGQPYVVVEHVKKGREHMHVVWSRISLETMTAIPDSHNYRKHEEVARGLEIDFGHQRLARVHTRDKEREPRPEPAPKFAEYQQFERSGMTPQEAKKIVTECWKMTSTGNDFRHRLEAEGFTVARGDRRDFVLIDRGGEIHGLTRRIEYVKAAEVRERMKDLDVDQLPDVAAARAQLRQRQKAQEREAAKEFTSAAERLRAEEVQREADAKGRNGGRLSSTDQEIADALWKLNQTMRGQVESTISGKPNYQERQQFRADLGARPEMDAERVRYQSGGRTEATGGGQQKEPQPQPQAHPSPGPIQPTMTPTPTRTAEPEQIEQPQPSLWQRLKGWVRGPGQERQGVRYRDSGGTDLPGTSPEATQRASERVAESRERGKTRIEAEDRPAAWLFVRIFGMVIDAYQHALDRAIADRARADEARKAEGLRHEAELRRAVEQHERDQAAKAQQQQTHQKPEPAKKPEPPKQPSQARTPDHETSPAASRAPATPKAPRVKRESVADEALREYNNRPESVREAERARAAAARLREEEERKKDHGRDRSPWDDDPRWG